MFQLSAWFADRKKKNCVHSGSDLQWQGILKLWYKVKGILRLHETMGEITAATKVFEETTSQSVRYHWL